jgi:type IV secretion system protein TrbI
VQAGTVIHAALITDIRSDLPGQITTQVTEAVYDSLAAGKYLLIPQGAKLIVQRELNIQPTLTIRLGFPVRVIVTRDLVLAPYSQGGTP